MAPATSSADGGLRLDRDAALLVLTGAGVSAESGLPTYRGSGGLWRSHPFERLASPEGFAADPALVWRFYSERREAALAARPNAGHRPWPRWSGGWATGSCSSPRTWTACTGVRGANG